MADIDPVIERIRSTIKKAPEGVVLNPNKTEGRKLEALLIELYTIAKNRTGAGGEGGFGDFLFGTYAGTANKFNLNATTESILGILLQTTDDSEFVANGFFRPSEFDFVPGTSEVNLTRPGFEAKPGHYLVVFQTGSGSPVNSATEAPWAEFPTGNSVTWDLDAWVKVKTLVLTGHLTINGTKGKDGQIRQLLVKQGTGGYTVTFDYESSPKALPISLEADTWTLLEGQHIGTNFILYPKATL